MTRTVFFDLDGTLTDPKPGITRCIQHAMERLGEPVPEADDLTWCIGPPLLQSFFKLVGEPRAAEALAIYRERFSDVGLFRKYDVIGALENGMHPIGALYGYGSREELEDAGARTFATRPPDLISALRSTN